MKMELNEFLEQTVPTYEDHKIEKGVYFAKITNVEPLSNERIKIKFDLEMEDGSIYPLTLRTNLVPRHSWDMINRLAEACESKKLKDFIGCQVWVSVVINERSDNIRYENIQDVMKVGEEDEFEYELSPKGYFIKQ